MLVFFDYDGVIVDSFAQVMNAARGAIEAVGAGRAPEKTDLHTIPNLTFQDFGRLLGVPEKLIDRFGAEMFRILSEDAITPPAFPGIPDVIRALAGAHTLAVVTATVRDTVRHALHRDGIAQCFSDIRDGTEPGTKSDKIRAGMRKFGFEPANVFMVGDTLGDIRQGRLAGVRTIAVSWGYQSADFLRAAKPDHVAALPADLAAILARG